MEIFNLQNLTFCFPEQTEPVLRDISFSVTPGRILRKICVNAASVIRCAAFIF